MDGSSYDTQHGRVTGAEPIAVIGAACRLPGAPDLDAFAALLAAGRDAVTEIPDGRWNKAQFLHPVRGQRGKAYTFAAGVLDQVDRFDPGFFGISPREAVQMDPQQRLLLELAHEAIEDAGLDGARLAGDPVGVFVGGSSWDYFSLHAVDFPAADAYAMTGGVLCSLSNRISYAFDLRGPSFTVDTACSSSLVALHQACEAIRAGQVPMALVGGVSLLLAPHAYVGFCQASMLSPRGRCHAFDARADGYVRAEGGGIVVLRPLRDAVAAGDPIRAVIQGTGCNSDGRTTGFSLPNKVAQAALLRNVYDRFGIDPDRLSYLEAHGTGTAAGDPIEAGALGEVLGRQRGRPLPIGSVKTNIGHLEAGSGMAGLLKAIVVLESGTIPRSLHCDTPNPAIPFDALNLRLVSEPIALAPGSRGQSAAMVGVNSFGFGGTNAHAVLEAAPAEFPAGAYGAAAGGGAADAVGPLPPLLLSARSEGALRDLARLWRDRLDGETDPAPLLRGAALAREQHPVRAVVLGGAPEKVLDGLDAYLSGRGTSAVATGTAVPGRVAFIFSGNGSQWAGMAADAMLGSTAFRAAMADVDAALSPWLGWSVQDRVAEADAVALRDSAVAQPLLFAIQAATVMALRAHGVLPDACMGHSVGEVAAAWAAGALSLDQAARVIAARSRRQRATAGQGSMGVIGLGHAAAAEALAGTELEVAAHNSTSATTVAGPEEALALLEERAAQERWAFTRLDLDYAFHSTAMDPIKAPLLADLEGLVPKSSTVPFVSTVTGDAADGTELDAAYWWRNVREPVRFAEAASKLVADGVRLFVEIGPQPVLQSYLHDALRQGERAGRVLSTLSRRQVEQDPLAVAAARCHAAGVDTRRIACFAGPYAVRGLPRYPWQRERFWAERTEEDRNVFTVPDEHPLLGVRTGPEPLEWSSHFGLGPQPWVTDHQVGGAAVLPAAAMIDMALAACRARHPAAPALEVLDLEIGRPLVLDSLETLRSVRLRVGPANGGFELSSRPRLSDEPWLVHATGRLVAAEDACAVASLSSASPAAAVLRRVEPDALYALASQLGLRYGPLFQAVTRVDVLGDRDAVVELALPDGFPAGYLVPPPLLDGALQGLVALAAGLLDSGGDGGAGGVLPWRFGRVRLLQVPLDADGDAGATSSRSAAAAAAAAASARLRITRVGPRSVRADILLLSADGTPLAELLECWFVRVALDRKATPEERLFHTALVPSVDARGGGGSGAPLNGVGMLRTALGDGPDASPLRSDDQGGGAELAAFADAFAASAAVDALRGLLSDDAELLPSAMVATGRIAADSRPLLDELVGWLDADGLIEARDDGRRVLADDAATLASGDADGPAALPETDELLRTLAWEQPSGIADAALLSLAADGLGRALRRGPDAMPAMPPALLDQFLHDSPAGARCCGLLLDGAGRLADAWPKDRPLRVLQLGAGRGSFSRRLLRRLSGVPGLELVAAATADDLPALAEVLAGVPGARAVAWQPGDPVAALGAGRGGFDAVLGLCALSLLALDRDALAELRTLLARPGGLLLVAEPEPNRTWRLVVPSAALRGSAGWMAALEAVGFRHPATQAFSDAAAAWPATLLGAESGEMPPPPPPPSSRAAPEMTGNHAGVRVAVLAEPGDRFAVALVEAVRSAMCGGDAAEADLLSSDALERLAASGLLAGKRLVLLPPPSSNEDRTDPAPWLARLAQLAGSPDLEGAQATIVLRSGPADDPDAAALAGARRVMANEAPNLPCRLVRLDPDMAPEDAVLRAMDEVLQPDGEMEAAWTTGSQGRPRRLVPRVRRGVPRAPSVDQASSSSPALLPMRLAVGRPGLLDSLRWDATAPAAPGPGQVAIAVQAAGLNFRDVMWALGLLPDEALLDGFAGPTMGLECAGTVTEVGQDVAGLKPGDRVMAFAPASLGSRVVTSAHAVLAMPDGMGFAEAATVPAAFMTVAYALGYLARLEAGERVLVHGGAGGVGLAAIQYAKHRGAVVFATAGSPAKRALLRRLGVDVVLDSRSLLFADEVMRLTDGEGVDVVLNSLSGEAMERSLGVLRPFGRFLELGKRDFYGNTPVGLRPFRHNVSYFGIDADQLPLRRPDLAAKLFAEIAGLLRDGAVRPLPHRAMGFAEVVDAFRLMQASGHVGKIVLVPDGTVPRAAAPAASAFAARADRTYLVTGGLDGFGLQAARWLADRGARHLVLLSRRGPATPGADDVLAAFEAEGVAAEAFACDVADETALAEVLDQVRGAMPPLAGVVHAAVAMDDALLPQVDASRFARALHPKLGGAEALDRLTRTDPVELFVLFSSVTTVLGNPGQAAYVAANAAVEAVAERRHREGLPALAVQWGPIGDAGYLAREKEVGALLARKLGRVHLSAAEALDALPMLLATGLPVVGFADTRWAGLRGGLPLLTTPALSELGSGAETAAEVDLREVLANCSPEEARERVAALLVEEVARIMKLAPDRIEVQRPLAELGMDSLMAVELRLAVEQRFGLAIPLMALSEGVTLAAMAGRIVRGLDAGAGEGDGQDGAISQHLAERIALYEDAEASAVAAPAADVLPEEARFAGPADHAEEPAEASFAAAAATVP